MAGKSKIESLRARKQRAQQKYERALQVLGAAKVKHDEAEAELDALTAELEQAEAAKRAELEAELAELTPATT